MTTGKVIEGFFIDFTSEELAEVRAELEDLGYKADGTGMKKFLLDSLFAEDEEEKPSSTENIIGITSEFLKGHPELIRMGVGTLEGFLKKAMRRR